MRQNWAVLRQNWAVAARFAELGCDASHIPLERGGLAGGGCVSYLGDLKRVIRELHQAEPRYVTSVLVREWFQGKLIWNGIVEVFDLDGHPNAERIYAWAHDCDDPKGLNQYVTALHIPPVVSPEMAVKAAIREGQKPPSAS